MPAYQRRVVDDELDELMPTLPAIALEGAKGVGKTATAEGRCRTVFQLDEPAQRAIAEADMALLLTRESPLFLMSGSECHLSGMPCGGLLTAIKRRDASC